MWKNKKQKGEPNKVPPNKKRRKAYDMSKFMKWAMLVFLIFAMGSQLRTAIKPVATDISYATYLEKLANGEVEKIVVYDDLDYFKVTLKDKESMRVPNPKYEEFKKEVLESGAEVIIKDQTLATAIPQILLGTPMLLFILAIIFYIYYAVASLGKSYFEAIDIEGGVSFDEVAGLSEIKKDLQFAVDFLGEPTRYEKSGAKVPRGYMLVGPPGTGKTLIAKAIAGEAKVPFISCCGTDFVEMYVGLGAKRVRDLITFASTNAPCVVFIDEIDAIGAARNIAGGDGGMREIGNTLNALLQKMDGISSTSGILFIAATNRLDVLDPALIRPGRFDRIIEINPPNNTADREQIIKVHLKDKQVSDDFDISLANRMLKGTSGADIAGILNEAVIVSLMNGNEGVITFKDFDMALSKIQCKGNLKPVIHNAQLNRVAVHEAGHAIAALLTGKHIRKVTIVPTTSGVGGYTLFDEFDDDDINLYSQDDLDSLIKILYGGLVAERLVYGTHSTGVSNDIERATKLITSRVTTYAMCDQFVDLTLLDKTKVAEQVEKIAQQVVMELTETFKAHEVEIRALSDQLLKEYTLYNVTFETIANKAD